jgi:tetratricopeptide (TPR) repeat protein
MRFSLILSFFVISSVEIVQGQSAFVKLGQKALIDGDFKSAVQHLEKACITDSTNSNALWMLGYSYYHCESYQNSIAAYSKLISIKPADASAYYFRSRSKSFLGKDARMSSEEKEKNLLGAIVDLTKAITIDKNDLKFYQNRGIAYRDYALFKLQKGNKFYDKNRGINSLRASITDLQKVLTESPGRKDIVLQLEMSKDQLNKALLINASTDR